MGDFRSCVNPESLRILDGCLIGWAIKETGAEERIPFLLQGYFLQDRDYLTMEKPVFNRVVTLKDSWVKEEKKEG